jgi:hypothetical protein
MPPRPPLFASPTTRQDKCRCCNRLAATGETGSYNIHITHIVSKHTTYKCTQFSNKMAVNSSPACAAIRNRVRDMIKVKVRKIPYEAQRSGKSPASEWKTPPKSLGQTFICKQALHSGWYLNTYFSQEPRAGRDSRTTSWRKITWRQTSQCANYCGSRATSSLVKIDIRRLLYVYVCAVCPSEIQNTYVAFNIFTRSKWHARA